MAKEVSTTDTAHNPMDQLGAIKNIIFGTEMQELSARIQQLVDSQEQMNLDWKSKIETLEAAISDDILALRQSLLSELHSRADSLQADLDIINEQKADRRMLGDLLIKVGEQLKKE